MKISNTSYVSSKLMLEAKEENALRDIRKRRNLNKPKDRRAKR